jgi:hypothetical protein
MTEHRPHSSFAACARGGSRRKQLQATYHRDLQRDREVRAETLARLRNVTLRVVQLMAAGPCAWRAFRSTAVCLLLPSCQLRQPSSRRMEMASCVIEACSTHSVGSPSASSIDGSGPSRRGEYAYAEVETPRAPKLYQPSVARPPTARA